MWGMGVFFKPLETEFGWTRTITSSGYTAFMVCYGISAIFIGRLLDRYGYRFVLLLAAFGTGGGIILLSQVQDINQFRIFMIISGLAIGGAFIGPTTVGQQWFSQRRGHVLGIITSGFGIGAAFFPPLLNHIIYNYGWRRGYVVLGSFILVSILASVITLGSVSDKEKPLKKRQSNVEMQSVVRGWSVRQIIRTPQFILLFVGGALGTIGFSMIQVHLVPYATDLGISPASAATAMALTGGLSIPIRLGIGFVEKKTGWHKILVAAHFLMAISIILLINLDSLPILYSFAVIFGLGLAALAPGIPGLLGTYFGMGSLGTIVGLTIGGGQITSGLLGPYIGGASYDATGSYFIALVIAVTLLIIATIMLFIARHPPVIEKESAESYNKKAN